LIGLIVNKSGDFVAGFNACHNVVWRSMHTYGLEAEKS
jgi:hypothetical protein